MHVRHPVAACFLLLAAATACPANTIAITEFMDTPAGEQNGREWVELFNYGDAPVNLQGWQFADEDNGVADVPPLTIKPGEYAIVVFGYGHQLPSGDKKEMFEIEWLGGKSDSRVAGIASSQFSLDEADEIILKNVARQVIWKVAYRKDGQPGRATYLAVNKFFPKQYGSKAEPRVNRSGKDFDSADGVFLGYESNAKTPDPLAWESDVSGLEKEWGERYRSIAKGGTTGPGTGSPLKGNYTIGGK